jgi:hypothetical protein
MPPIPDRDRCDKQTDRGTGTMFAHRFHYRFISIRPYSKRPMSDWQALPEEMRVWIRAGIKARAEGLSPSQASDVADAEVARHRELTAKYEATFADTRPGLVARAAQETAEAKKTAMPRVRGL